MTHIQPADFYERKRTEFAQSLNDVKKQINAISNIRIAVAVIFLLVLYFGSSNSSLLYVLAVLLAGFILLVRKHAALFVEKTHLENLMKIQVNELHALQGDVSQFSAGLEFMDPHHAYTHDLDIFGEGSLFQYLNRVSTRSGKTLLANRLSTPPLTVEEIVNHQEAIRELATKTDFRHQIQAHGMQIDEQPDDDSQLAHWLRQPPFLYGKTSYKIILSVFPVLTISLVVTAFLIDGFTSYALLCAGLQWAFLGTHLKKVNTFHQYISRKKNALEKYAQILFYIRRENFASTSMKRLGEQASEADQKIRELAGLVRALDARLNFMTNLFVNSLFLYDLQCVVRLERWKEENSNHLLGWLNTIRETEVLCSFGTFAFNHPAFIFPTINTQQNLYAEDLAHPLLSSDERVANDIRMDKQESIMIITGANMAGKSTFLRCVGINMVLALAGSPVCARSFDCPLMEMRSGMRTADSLQAHQSYFYAELDRLKTIMDELRTGKSLLILLDEILKGTNSTDKQAGSVALVRQLVDHSCLVLIATHDLALGNLETVHPGRILNYCFEANIENDHLSFDYKLKRGLAQKMNATFLMKKMGIII